MTDYPRIDTVHGRAYVLRPGVIAPSVTSVLRGTADTTSIEAWKKKVGKKEAQRRLEEGSKRGDALHQAMERWADTRDPGEGTGPWWDAMKPVLPRIVQPLFPEAAVASGKPGEEYCGTVDLGALWQTERYGVRRAVLDYKTGNRPKHNRYLADYRLQLGAYILTDEARDAGIEVGVLIHLCPNEPAQILELVGPPLDAACRSWGHRLAWYHSGVMGSWAAIQEAADGLY